MVVLSRIGAVVALLTSLLPVSAHAQRQSMSALQKRALTPAGQGSHWELTAFNGIYLAKDLYRRVARALASTIRTRTAAGWRTTRASSSASSCRMRGRTRRSRRARATPGSRTRRRSASSSCSRRTWAR